MLTWELLGHNQNATESQNYGAHRETNNETRAPRNDDDLAQHHKYPDDKHTKHIGSAWKGAGWWETLAGGKNQLATVH